MQTTCFGPCIGPSTSLTCVGGDYTVFFLQPRWVITTSTISRCTAKRDIVVLRYEISFFCGTRSRFAVQRDIEVLMSLLGCKNTLYSLLQRKLDLKMAQYKGRNMSSA